MELKENGGISFEEMIDAVQVVNYVVLEMLTGDASGKVMCDRLEIVTCH